MKKITFLFLLAAPVYSFSQLGIKAGLNFANVTNASSINSSSQTGFHGGILLAPSTRGIIGSRTELILSRQGYNYKTSSNTGNVNLDYIMLPQLMTINITKYFQLQLGAQMAYLINASVDSSANTGNQMADRLLDLYNRFDYGFAGGVEIHPVAGLLVGARMNISLNQLYKDPAALATAGSFIPKVDVKNNVFQVFAGWRFGKQPTNNGK